MINMLPRKTFLLSHQDPEAEKERSKDFNVPIGCYERRKIVSNIKGLFFGSFLKNHVLLYLNDYQQ